MVHYTSRNPRLVNKRTTKQSSPTKNSHRSINKNNAPASPCGLRVVKKSSSVGNIKQHPSHALLENFSSFRYQSFKQRCLKDRMEKGAGKSAQMNTLFCFWTNYLRNCFSQKIYEEFKHFAVEDNEAGFKYGIQCLFRFYSFGLEIQFRPELFLEFQRLALVEYHDKNNLYGLEKVWGFLTFRKEKSPVDLLPDVAELLNTQFKSLEDFRIAQEAIRNSAI